MMSKAFENVCPKCDEVGPPVASLTVRHIVKRDLKERISGSNYHLCNSPHCEVGYFNRDTDEIIHKNDFKRPIWFKEGANPAYACYCLSITEEEVIKAVIETDLTDLTEISLYLRGRIGSHCHVTNPSGHCCSDAFDSMISKGLGIKETLSKYDHLAIDSVQIEKAKLGHANPPCDCSCKSSKKTQ